MAAKKLTWKQHVTRRALGKPGYPIVEILWWDALAKATDNWQEDITNEATMVSTCGYLTFSDGEVVTVMSLIHTHAVGHGITIPISCIIGDIRYL